MPARRYFAQLAGAGLDVFADEPYVPTELCGMDNVVLLPHIGGATVRSLSMMRELVLRNLDQYLSYGTLTTPVVPVNRRVLTGLTSVPVSGREAASIGRAPARLCTLKGEQAQQKPKGGGGHGRSDRDAGS